jgi:hypothetical protein
MPPSRPQGAAAAGDRVRPGHCPKSRRLCSLSPRLGAPAGYGPASAVGFSMTLNNLRKNAGIFNRRLLVERQAEAYRRHPIGRIPLASSACLSTSWTGP